MTWNSVSICWAWAEPSRGKSVGVTNEIKIPPPITTIAMIISGRMFMPGLEEGRFINCSQKTERRSESYATRESTHKIYLLTTVNATFHGAVCSILHKVHSQILLSSQYI